jgi:hypothetical protein
VIDKHARRRLSAATSGFLDYGDDSSAAVDTRSGVMAGTSPGV